MEEHTRFEQEVSKYFSGLSPDSFESSNCIFIHSQPPKHIPLFKKDTLEVVRCECDFVYSKNQPKQIALDEFYTKSKAMDQWVEVKKTRNEAIRQADKYAWVIDYLKNMDVKSLLDIGCGTGKFLSLINKAIPKAKLYGVDQNLASLKEQSLDGIEIYHRSIHEFLETCEEKFEAISLWGVLEHVKDPVGLLYKVSKLLTGPKLLVVCVPNVESDVVVYAREKCFTFCPQHLWHFSKSTLERAFHQAGFSMKVNNTIEPESVPVQKMIKGFGPYDDLPDWAQEFFLSKSQKEYLDRAILASGRGYKIVAIGSPR